MDGVESGVAQARILVVSTLHPFMILIKQGCVLAAAVHAMHVRQASSPGPAPWLDLAWLDLQGQTGPGSNQLFAQSTFTLAARTSI